MSQKLRYAIVGSGAVGSYYGAMLARSGCDVHFLMRSDFDIVQKFGLTIRSKDGNFHLPRVNVHRATREIRGCDVVLIALKTTANNVLPELIPPLLKDNTLLITLQNGLGNEEFLSQHFGAQRVAGGLCFVCLNRVAHGVVEHYGHGTLSMGEFNRAPSERILQVVSDFQQSGIEAKAVENLITERWRKLVWNIPFNGLGVAARANVEEVLQNDVLHSVARELMRETIEAAGKLGHPIPLDFIDFQIQRSWPMGRYRSSSQIDFENGHEVEIEAIWGEPYRQAKRAGADTPRLEMLYGLIQRLVPLNTNPTK